MPELPEVETVRRGLESIVSQQPVIKEIRLMRPDIRFTIPKDLPKRFKGQKITGVRRRAKYLLIDTPKVTLLSHLGMTGSWRVAPPGDEDKHDHCYIELDNGSRLAFRDPRRFGILDLVEAGQEKFHPRLKDLGVEPLDQERFTAQHLFQLSRKKRVAVKVFIMDQRVVVGVGNIYASEALYCAGIRPTKLAGRLSMLECERLVTCIRDVLKNAIEAGGSSIRDYRQASGDAGGFQDQHQVYDRAGEPCVKCGQKIRSKVVGGRSTYWCPKCQT